MNAIRAIALLCAVACLWTVSPESSAHGPAPGEAAARDFLQKRFGPAANPANLRLTRVRQSLLGAHYVFTQTLHGIPVEDASITVTTPHSSGGPFAVHGRVRPMAAAAKPSPNPALSLDQAFDAAWRALRVRGALWDEPAGDLVWRRNESGLRLAYRVRLAVSAPFGRWECHIDAHDGRALAVANRAPARVRVRAKTDRPLADREAAFAAWRESRDQAARRGKTAGKRAVGSAMVFDPDPRTALGRDDLEDDDPAAAFADAYVLRPLPDVTQRADGFHLEGPWARVADFDAPAGQPEPTVAGVWDSRRGERAFLEANAYFHVDQNQRYLQSLGFDGETGVQQRAVDIDVDAANGADHAYYAPGVNRLGFGRGCVDDAEDADVVLHEYALALVEDILPDWTGGDAGAIAKGFADYWAASYSYGTANGATFHPDWMYTWDGHNRCWAGRALNQVDAAYDPERTYAADQLLSDGTWALELWSAALFQPMKQLVAMGRPRQEADLIAIQTLFALSDGALMRDAALAALAAAEALFPDGPHASVYRDQFLRQNLIEEVLEPKPQLFISGIQAGDNLRPDPGETVSLPLLLIPTGSVLQDIFGKLTTESEGVTVLTTQSIAFIQSESGAIFTEEPFQVALADDAACGQTIVLNVRLRYQDENGESASDTIPLTLSVGAPLPFERLESGAIAIPDHGRGVLERTIRVEGVELIYDRPVQVNDSFRVEIALNHPWLRDLAVSLISPSGKTVRLVDRRAAWENRFFNQVVFPTDLEPIDSFQNLMGEPIEGEWRLRVEDLQTFDEGSLEGWAIRLEAVDTLCDDSTPAVGRNRLHFSFVEADENWGTLLRLINPGDTELAFDLLGLDQDGVGLFRTPRALAPRARLTLPVAELDSRPERIRAIRVEADGPIHGFAEAIDPAREKAFATPGSPSEILFFRLYAPHVAESDLFWTRGHVTNWNFTGASFQATNAELFKFGEQGAFATLSEDLRDFIFDGFIPPGQGWFELAGFGLYSGVEVFGQHPPFANAAGLRLDGVPASTLIMPHIPADKAVWWSGLTLVNLTSVFSGGSGEPAPVTATVFDPAGDPLAVAELMVEPGQKRVGLLQDFFPDQDVDAGAWVRFDAEVPLTGYELFGTFDRSAMAGLESLSAGATVQVLGHIQANADGRWTGIGALNPGDEPAELVFQAYSDSGEPIGEPRIHVLAPRVKKIGFAEDFVDVGPGGWALVQSDRPVVVFELFGEGVLRMVSGLNALR